MKAALLFCLLSTLLIPGLAAPREGHAAISLERYETARSTAVKAGGCEKELCNVCIQFAEQTINILLNLILDDAVVGSCDLLCGALAKRTDKLVGEVCDILCVAVGIDGFIRILDRTDIDPIYYCELLDACAINDNGDAKITNATVHPKSGPQGEKFKFSMTFVTKNGTGTGELVIAIDTVDGIPVGDGEVSCEEPGMYNVGWDLNTEPSSDCQEPPCEMWLPGIYNVTLAVCYGECGSKHPHSAIYDIAFLSFKITG